jgi:hypothetical protein
VPLLWNFLCRLVSLARDPSPRNGDEAALDDGKLPRTGSFPNIVASLLAALLLLYCIQLFNASLFLKGQLVNQGWFGMYMTRVDPAAMPLKFNEIKDLHRCAPF